MDSGSGDGHLERDIDSGVRRCRKSDTVIATLAGSAGSAGSGVLLWKTRVGLHDDDECQAPPPHATGNLYSEEKGRVSGEG